MRPTHASLWERGCGSDAEVNCHNQAGKQYHRSMSLLNCGIYQRGRVSSVADTELHGVYQIDGMKFPDFSLIFPWLFQVIFFQVHMRL